MRRTALRESVRAFADRRKSSNRESRRSLNANQKHQHPTEEQHRSNAEAHWRKQIRIERIGLTLSIVATGAAIAAGVGAWYAYWQAKRQADAAVAAADTARDQAENMDRAWIKMVSLEHPDMRFTGPGTARKVGFSGERQEVFIGVTPQLKNVGKTTAIHVHVRAELVIHKWANGWSDLDLEQKAACAVAQNAGGSYNATLFPDDPFNAFTTPDGVFLSQDNISVAGETKYVAPAIVGCVDYQFSSSRKHHQTRFVYRVIRSDNRSRFFIVGQDVPESGILLIRDPQYDYAD
jgi:hypothetical protein